MGDVVAAKKIIENSVGDKKIFGKYLSILSSYYKFEISQDEMEIEVRKILSLEQAHYHNSLVMAIAFRAGVEKFIPDISFVKQESNHKDVKEKIKKKIKPSHNPYNSRLSSVVLEACLPPVVAAPFHDFCSFYGLFPDIETLYGQIYIFIWMCDIENINEMCTQYIAISVQSFIKNILMSIFAKRTSYRLRGNNFMYAVGANRINILSQNSRKLPRSSSHRIATALSDTGELVAKANPTVDSGQNEAAYEAACDNSSSFTLPPVTLKDLFDVLKVNPCQFNHKKKKILMHIFSDLDETWQTYVHHSPEQVQRTLIPVVPIQTRVLRNCIAKYYPKEEEIYETVKRHKQSSVEEFTR